MIDGSVWNIVYMILVQTQQFFHFLDNTWVHQNLCESVSFIINVCILFTFQHVLVFKDQVMWFHLMVQRFMKFQTSKEQIDGCGLFNASSFYNKIGYCVLQHRRSVINWNKNIESNRNVTGRRRLQTAVIQF